MVPVVSYVEDTRKKCKGEAPDMLEAFSISDVGKKRQINQDCVDVSTGPVGNLPNLLLLADGMGGHKAGEVASAIVINHLQ